MTPSRDRPGAPPGGSPPPPRDGAGSVPARLDRGVTGLEPGIVQPGQGGRSFKRGLLFFTVIFAILFLLDVALVGNLIFRDLSKRVASDARMRSRAEAEAIARQLTPAQLTDLYRVVQTTTLFASYLDRILQEYTIIQRIDIVDDDGRPVFSKARRADILRSDEEPLRPDPTAELPIQPRSGGRRALGRGDPVRRDERLVGSPDTIPPALLTPEQVLQHSAPGTPAPLPPPSRTEGSPGDDAPLEEAPPVELGPGETLRLRDSDQREGSVPSFQEQVLQGDQAREALQRMGIPLPAEQLGAGSPRNLKRFRQSRSTYDVTVPLEGQDGFVGVSLSEDELGRQIDELRRDLMIKILVGAALSLVLIIVAYVFVVKLFNKTRRLETEAQMADRLAYVGTLAAGLAHEIRNPLSAMKLNLQMLESVHRDEDGNETEDLLPRLPANSDGEAEELLRETREEVDRLGELVTSFLSYARPARLERQPTDLNRIIEETAHFLSADAEQRQVKLQVRLAEDLPLVPVDPKQLRQALLNVLRNAVTALEEQRGGMVEISTGWHPSGDVQIVIEDDGPGIPQDRQAEIFQVFYSNKPGGTGLGLPIAQRILEGHGGRIELESAPGSGTRFSLILPRPAASTVKAAL